MKLIIILFFLFASKLALADDVIRTDTNSTVTTNGSMDTTVNSTPPSAISPHFGTTGSDLCTVGVAGAVQTQILGLSAGKTVRDMNCEKLKNAKTMHDLGMKVAAVSVMCQDERIFKAMLNAGTPCPKDGLIGDEAKIAWEMEAAKDKIERDQNNVMRKIFNENTETKVGLGVIISTLAFLLLF